MRVNARQAAQQAQHHLRAGKPRDALDITRQLVTAFPDLPAANLLHAEALTRLTLARTALPHIDAALTATLPPPTRATAWLLRADNLRQIADPQGTAAALQQAFNEHPAHPRARLALAEHWLDHNDPATAADLLTDAPNTPDTALLRARLCRLTDQPDEAHPILDPLIADPATPARARSALRFAKAHCLESAEQYDDAFPEYTRANQDLGATFDSDLLARQTTAALTALTDLPAPNSPCRVALIVGMPRSGTSLTEQILAAHPDIGAAGESQSLPHLARHPSPEAGDHYTAELAAAATREHPRVLTDKNPMNLFLLGPAARHVPGLRVIRLRRDPMDVCTSCYTAPLGPDHAYATDLTHCAAYYAAADRVLNAASHALGDAMLTVDYESLVRDPDPAVRAMLTHLGLDFDDRCLHPEQSARVVQTSSRDQVTSTISDRSVGRWRRYESHLGPLRAALDEAGLGAQA